MVHHSYFNILWKVLRLNTYFKMQNACFSSQSFSTWIAQYFQNEMMVVVTYDTFWTTEICKYFFLIWLLFNKLYAKLSYNVWRTFWQEIISNYWAHFLQIAFKVLDFRSKWSSNFSQDEIAVDSNKESDW